jgi:3-isopropylmalate/(R)-2-methylmalate dehydratase large subunit
MGIEHVLLPEEGLIKPGDLIIGADSHTTTYGALGAFSTGVGSTDLAFCWAKGVCWFKIPESIKLIYFGKLNRWVGAKDIILHTIADLGVNGANYKVMEFTGETIRNLSIEARLTVCNMAVEAGAKAGIISPDKLTLNYIRRVSPHKLTKEQIKRYYELKSDTDANYVEVREYDVRNLQPQVASPPSPASVKPVTELTHVKIDQVFIGSCTNGRISDLREAAKILKDKKINSSVRLLISPATPRVYLKALEEGLIKIFLEAGAVVCTPSCGPCLGGHHGVLAQGERCLATTNRNFRGRMGDADSFVYLANPQVAAATAIKGRIAHPEEVI